MMDLGVEGGLNGALDPEHLTHRVLVPVADLVKRFKLIGSQNNK